MSNVFFSRMRRMMNQVIHGTCYPPCSSRVAGLIETFYEESTKVDVDWQNGKSECGQVEAVMEVAKYLAENTCPYEPLSDKDFGFIEKIFQELEELRGEAVELKMYPERSDTMRGKISCIREILCKNMAGISYYKEARATNRRDGMIFQNYEDLWKIIHRIVTEWDELASRGFSLNVFYDYWSSFKYDRCNGKEKSESEKLRIFMAMLDGNMKFVPLYRIEPEGYALVEETSEEERITIGTFERASYSLKRKEN